MTDDPSFSYEKLGTRNVYVCHHFSYEFFSRTRNLDELEHCSILYEKPGVTTEMLRRYWLEVRFVFVYNISLLAD